MAIITKEVTKTIYVCTICNEEASASDSFLKNEMCSNCYIKKTKKEQLNCSHQFEVGSPDWYINTEEFNSDYNSIAFNRRCEKCKLSIQKEIYFEGTPSMDANNAVQKLFCPEIDTDLVQKKLNVHTEEQLDKLEKLFKKI